MEIPRDSFRVLIADLAGQTGEIVQFGERREFLGGSGLAAALYERYGAPTEPANHPDQPLIFAVGPLTGFFPLMTKVVLGFKSPYHQQYAESHAGGRLGLALRFAGYDALVVLGAAKTPTCLVVGRDAPAFRDVHYLWGKDAISTGKLLRRICPSNKGRRSILRIGPGGERGVNYAGINVDSYRHFGRLGGGAVMGSKRLKGIVVHGEGSYDLPQGKQYARLYKDLHKQMTQTPVMKKYHDLGTPENLLTLNAMQALPVRNLQAGSHEAIEEISGERFAEQFLLRKTACAGCPVGCIHVGLLREKFADEHEFMYRQVSYDYEPIFALGTMLGMSRASDVLALIEESERQGLDVMSTGVALAWATEALEKGVVGEKETICRLAFDNVGGYREAVRHVGERTNDFYRLLGQGTGVAAGVYGGGDYACVLGQEMAGYATGPVFIASQAYGFRHSHLDSGGYSFDQKSDRRDAEAAVRFLLEDEKARIELTCMVSCLFARSVYSRERLQEALESLGWKDIADALADRAEAVQVLRWRLRFRTGYDPGEVTVPERFRTIVTWQGPMDRDYLDEVCRRYAAAIVGIGEAAG